MPKFKMKLTQNLNNNGTVSKKNNFKISTCKNKCIPKSITKLKPQNIKSITKKLISQKKNLEKRKKRYQLNKKKKSKK